MQFVVPLAAQEIAVRVGESDGVFRANIDHVHRHAGTGGVGVGEESGACVDIVERIRREGRVTGEDVDPVPVRIKEAIRHEWLRCVDEDVAHPRGRTRRFIQQRAGGSIRCERLTFHDPELGCHATHKHLGGIDVFMIDEPGQHVEGRTILRISMSAGTSEASGNCIGFAVSLFPSG